ncbi:phage tail assembly chaperone [Algibacter sp.]|nr:phage tail assembly chaperone [Algibacter sp.]
MEFKSIENLSAIDRIYSEENRDLYQELQRLLVGDVIKFTCNNGVVISKLIVEQDVMVDNPTEEEIEAVTLSIDAKKWRNRELESTDILSLLADHPNNANILLYRQELRDWPNTSTFPLTKPKLN